MISDPQTGEKPVAHACIDYQGKTSVSAQQRLNDIIQSDASFCLYHSKHAPHITVAVANTWVLGHVNLKMVSITVSKTIRDHNLPVLLRNGAHVPATVA